MRTETAKTRMTEKSEIAIKNNRIRGKNKSRNNNKSRRIKSGNIKRSNIKDISRIELREKIIE